MLITLQLVISRNKGLLKIMNWKQKIGKVI